MRTRRWKGAALGLIGVTSVACGSTGSTSTGAQDGATPPDGQQTQDTGTKQGDASLPDAGRDARIPHDARDAMPVQDSGLADVGQHDGSGDASEDAPKDAPKDVFVATCTGCTSTEVCVDGGCAACGGSGEPCCAGSACTGSGLACASGTCEACGASSGDPCCAGSTCTGSSLACVSSSCVTCGGSGEACCTTGSACNTATLACAAGTCATCGGAGEPCCGGTTCGVDLSCKGGTCECGNYGETCCSGNSCDTENLACVSGSCTCGAIEQVCCAVMAGGPAACATIGGGGAPTACAPGGECSCLKACDNSEVQRNDNTLVDPGATNALTYDGLNSLVAVDFSGSGNLLGCAVDANAALWCWGSNNAFGQLGNGTTVVPQPSYQARQVLTAAATPLTGITKVVVDPRQGFTACAIDTNSDLWCWGCPDFNSPSTVSLYATKILTSAGGSAFTGVTDVAVGEFHTCAITSDGNVWCWGDNDSGQLGTGDTTGTTQLYPVKVPYFQTNTLQVKTVAVGSSGGPGNTYGVTCASTSAGNAYCWGSNASGALEGSINQGTRAYVPIEMLAAAGGAPVSAVASIQVISSNSSPCLTSTTGEVSCWGSLPHLANWPSPYYPSPYQEGGAFPLILKLCGNTGYGNSGTLGTTFLDTNGIYHEGGMAYVGGQAPTCGP